MSYKITLLIFLLFAILITIFPPFSWGEERLQTEVERNKELYDLGGLPAHSILPLKQRAFLFSDTKQLLTIKVPNADPSYKYTAKLDRKLLFGDFILEYLLAALLATLAGWLISKLFHLK